MSKTLEELNFYKTASLKEGYRPEYTSPDPLTGELTTCQSYEQYLVFEKLYTIRKGNARNLEYNTDATEFKNSLVRATGDEHRKYFTRIPGLREEINNLLVDYIDICSRDKTTFWIKRTCASFGTHQLFALYAARIQKWLDELEPKLTKIKNNVKQSRAAKASEEVKVLTKQRIKHDGIMSVLGET